jgi:hypothetical protein
VGDEGIMKPSQVLIAGPAKVCKKASSLDSQSTVGIAEKMVAPSICSRCQAFGRWRTNEKSNRKVITLIAIEHQGFFYFYIVRFGNTSTDMYICFTVTSKRSFNVLLEIRH